MEIWLDNPVTQAVFQGYEEVKKKIQGQISSGAFITSGNNDLSMNQLHLAKGHVQGMDNALEAENILRLCKFIEEDKDEQ